MKSPKAEPIFVNGVQAQSIPVEVVINTGVDKLMMSV
jgi:hypothetical protein